MCNMPRLFMIQPDLNVPTLLDIRMLQKHSILIPHLACFPLNSLA